MEILKVKELYKTYINGENEAKALNGISFSVETGEFVAVVGQSGSGKSTLLHLIGGVDSPTSGSITLNGEEIYQKSSEKLAVYRRNQVGLIYQFYNLIPILDVEENITLPLVLDGKKIDEKQLAELIDTLGLKGKTKSFPSQLSGGQQQRVAIGRALINSPVLILADEPTGNLDSKNSHEIIELLKMSNKKYNQTLIIVTHDEGIASQAERIIRLQDGNIVSDEKKK